MDTQPCGPDEAFARDLAELDRELEARVDQSNAHELPPEESRRLIAGLLAGLALVGRPRDMHQSMERLANAGVSPADATRLVG
jgi:hypothetical protein